MTDLNGCADVATTNVIASGDQLGVFVEADNTALCLGENTTLHVTAFGGGSSNLHLFMDHKQFELAIFTSKPNSGSTKQYNVPRGGRRWLYECGRRAEHYCKATAAIDIAPIGYRLLTTHICCVRDSVILMQDQI